MLQIKNISKQYITGDLVQDALNDVSLNFRKSEFVAILGPSGSGKTTMLNVIGGLDRYDSGDLVINDISTKEYKDPDWDSYRNHTIGFVFQSFNLIPHQSILSNVELALTISGISKQERRRRAISSLKQVGLGTQLHKKPNQMSGGQMQRVAIARALVNNPDILLADEPTGSLDSETSIQVMELLKEVANDRLVIMVTHDSELSKQYATRTIKLRDGKIIDDSDPHLLDDANLGEPKHKNMGKSSMSFFTSLSLSFNNLRTKKARTILTAFAGSIGIIGIALILSLSNGVNTYIEDIQKDTMASYPITIDAQTFDFASMMGGGPPAYLRRELEHDLNAVYSNSTSLEMLNMLTTNVAKNNLTEFKRYLDDPNSEIHNHLGTNGVIYSYNVPFSVYTRNTDGRLIDVNSNAFIPGGMPADAPGALGTVQQAMIGNMTAIMDPAAHNPMFSPEVFSEIIPNNDGTLISSLITDSYDLLFGNWPQSYNEVVLVLDENNELPITVLYALGLIASDEYDSIVNAIESSQEFEIETYSYKYEDISQQTFYLIPASDYYVANNDGTFSYMGEDPSFLDQAITNGIELNISGIIRPFSTEINSPLSGAIGYTHDLTNYIIDYANNSPAIIAQKASPDINILNGLHFNPSDNQSKINDARNYLLNMDASEKIMLLRDLSSMASMTNIAMPINPFQLQTMQALGEDNLVIMVDHYIENADDHILLNIYDSFISTGNYADNMSTFGFVNLDAPASISIYADTFEGKDAIATTIRQYNETADDEYQIVYTDFVAMMTSSITTIINVVSYVLIAFVAVSLVVSSIMIGIITYISVLERTKEIGILRAIGASKQNISEVFNAETFIIGLLSGLLGVGVSRLLLIPGNAIIHALIGSSDVNAILPVTGGVILIILSVILTLIGGIIPSKQAARKDPVAALRTE